VEGSKRSAIFGTTASYDIAEETKLGFVAKLTFHQSYHQRLKRILLALVQ